MKRVLLGIPTVLGVVTLVFFSMHLAPGDPVNLFVPPDASGAVREEIIENVTEIYGFDDPLHEQYFEFVRDIFVLDFGRSLKSGNKVVDDLNHYLPKTLEIGIAALALTVLVGVTSGVISAVKKGSTVDQVVMFVALFGVSTPSFWLGMMLMLLFGLIFSILPISGYGGPFYTFEGLRHLILPAMTLGLIRAGGLARYARASMLEIINQEYIRTARAKGLSERVVIYKHALRNALIPVITMIGLYFGWIFAGTVVIETVFGWPGVGRYLIIGINNRDFPVVQGTVFVMAIGFVVANLLTDMVYAYVDPRIRYE